MLILRFPIDLNELNEGLARAAAVDIGSIEIGAERYGPSMPFLLMPSPSPLRALFPLPVVANLAESKLRRSQLLVYRRTDYSRYPEDQASLGMHAHSPL